MKKYKISVVACYVVGCGKSVVRFPEKLFFKTTALSITDDCLFPNDVEILLKPNGVNLKNV
jgi:hypothetical protein